MASNMNTYTPGINGNQKPFSDCPPMCLAAPLACGECSECRKKLFQALHKLEHMDELMEQCIIDPNAPPGGERICWFCGASVEMALTECDYCGSELNDENSPIRIQNKKELQKPLYEAINRVFERRQILKRYQEQKKSTSGFFKGLMISAATMGQNLTGYDKPMTVDEVYEMAESYNVPVHKYLRGLDGNTYLTKAAKQMQDRLNQANQNMGQQPVSTYSAGSSAKRCMMCHGSGLCSWCKGTRMGGYTVAHVPQICTTCGGSGICKVCHGTGYT